MAEETARDPADWRRPPVPGAMTLAGRWARVSPLAPAHAAGLHAAFAVDDAIWKFMGYGPFPDAAAFGAWVVAAAAGPDPRFFAIRDLAQPAAGGVASLMRVDPGHGTAEIGHVCLAPGLQRTRAASEAMHLLADWAFRAGYRRLEWKCDAANAASRRAAARFGFAFEGVFRQHMIVKGRNRDTAWFAIVDGDWPALRAAHRRWLDPANFDADGRQRERLGALTAPIRMRAEATLRSL